MNKLVKRWISAALCLACLLPATSAVSPQPGQPVQIGLHYGENALAAANLENKDGSGYYMGYTSADGAFTSLAYTGETMITMLKTQTMYLSNGSYSTTAGAGTVIGCYHLQVGSGYAGFDEANAKAAQYAGGFPAWVGGTYSVRVGAYATSGEAEAAKAALGLGDASVVGTSAYGIHVVKTKTGAILFQFDGGEQTLLTVRPGLDQNVKAVTWCKGYSYYGDFRYERLKGGDLTVVNIVAMDDYINCVISREMSESWPLEALKAQAVCARTYAERNRGEHKAYHFDLCSTTDCQAYSGTSRIGPNTAQAAAETSGIHVWYSGAMADTVYYSSNGGASENSENIWNQPIPYLVGKLDPYEAYVVDKIPSYHWTKTFTKAELAEMLRSRGYQCADIVDFRASGISPTGNVITITFTDSAGKSFSFSKEKYTRIMMGVRSSRYTISGGGKYYVDATGDALSGLGGVYAIGADGTTAPVGLNEVPFYIGGTGTVAQFTPVGDTFTITGTGWGHHVGMSQWGAYSMALQGKTYQEILTFYYTGIELH